MSKQWGKMGWMAAAAFGAGGSDLAAAGEPEPGHSGIVFSTVGHSEWCPSGTVRLDLATGRYTVTAPSTWRECRRPPFRSRINAGVLDADELVRARDAYRSVEAEGLEHRACRNGGRPDRIIVSGSRTPILRMINRARTRTAPAEHSCWSDAGLQFRRVLEDLFNPRTARRR